MKKIISIVLLIVTIITSSYIYCDRTTAKAEEKEEYYSIPVKYLGENEGIEYLQVMVYDENVYVNAEQLYERLGYSVKICDEYVAIYNKAKSDDMPYGITIFYYNSDNIKHMLFNKLVDYRAVFSSRKIDDKAWIPLEQSLLILNSGYIRAEDAFCIQKPQKNIIDIYTELMILNEEYSFDFTRDIGISPDNLDTMAKSAYFVTLLNGIIKLDDGVSWAELIDKTLYYSDGDGSAYDSKYGQKLATLFCTYSSDEYEEEIYSMKRVVDELQGDGIIEASLYGIANENIYKISDFQKKIEEIVNNSDYKINNDKTYQLLQKLYKQNSILYNFEEFANNVENELANVSDMLSKIVNLVEVTGYVSEFMEAEDFSKIALKEFLNDTQFGDMGLVERMKDTMQDYLYVLDSNVLTYSVIRYIQENYMDIILDKKILSDVLGVEAVIISFTWDLISNNVPYFKDGIEQTDEYILSIYASIMENYAFSSYLSTRNVIFTDENQITLDNLSELSKKCFAYLKMIYIERQASLGALNDDTKSQIPSVIKEQQSINKRIAKLLNILQNSNSQNDDKKYGFLPEDNNEFISETKKTDILNWVESCDVRKELIGKWKIDATMTMKKNGVSMTYLFGTGYKYGSLMQLDEDGEFLYYLAIADSGKGTWRLQGSQIEYDLYKHSPKDGTMTIIKNKNENIIVMDYFEYKIYWKKEQVNSDYTSSSDYKQAYKKYIIENCNNSDKDRYQFGLVNITSDVIPQLYIEYGSVAKGAALYVYYNGEIKEQRMYEYGLSYIEYKNIFMDAGGRMDEYYNNIYQITDDGIKKIAGGRFGAVDNSKVQYDNNGIPIYQYFWNEIKLENKEEYEKMLDLAYDRKSAINPFENKAGNKSMYNYEEIIKLLTN